MDDIELSPYEGYMLYPYATDLSLAEVEARWPEAVVLADSQLVDVLSDDRPLRYVEDKKGRLRAVWRDEGRRERMRRIGIDCSIESATARWVPAHRVWVRYSTSISCKPYEPPDGEIYDQMRELGSAGTTAATTTAAVA